MTNQQLPLELVTQEPPTFDNFVAGPNGLNQSATFGTINSARDPRIIQLGLKLTF